MKKLFKNKKILILVLVILFILIGGTFAYFSIQYNTDNKSATITGKAGDIGNTILTTNISKLYMNIDGRVMNPNKTGVTYYATTDESGEALESDPNYVLATISTTSENALECTYNYKITATLKNSITDGSDENITVTIGNVTKTLKEILDAGTDGIIISDSIYQLTKINNKNIHISSKVINTSVAQNDLQNNFYTINIEQYKKDNSKALSCKISNSQSPYSFSSHLIAKGEMWESGLDGDGYRYIGTSEQRYVCSYDDGNYFNNADNQDTTPTCPTLYNYTGTRISDGYTYNETYQTSCPSDDSDYKYSCTEFNGTLITLDVQSSNYVCFGTIDKEKCLNNTDTYLYRIIGVFYDESKNNHVKLIKNSKVDTYVNTCSTISTQTFVGSEELNDLNGLGFLNNISYSYMQEDDWLNIIENWNWRSFRTQSESIFDGRYFDAKCIYLHEMGKDKYCIYYNNLADELGGTIWETTINKLGFIYASDYALSLGSLSLDLSNKGLDYSKFLKYSWVHSFQATMGLMMSNIISMNPDGDLYWFYGCSSGVTPTFYLTSDAMYSSGTGTIDDPYMIMPS